jgi:ATP-dependent DNA helicase RecQ
VDFTSGDRPMLVLTGSGRAVMKGERPPRLALPRLRGPGLVSRPLGPGKGSRKDVEGLPPEAEPLFAALRRLRLELAREEGLPAYMIASDRTLRDVAVLRPETLAELQRAHGIGALKAGRYGARLLRAVAEAASPGSPPAARPIDSGPEPVV